MSGRLSFHCSPLLVLGVLGLVCEVASGVHLRTSSPSKLTFAQKPLCRVTSPIGNQGSNFALDVWQLPGNVRSISFEDSLSYESMIKCGGKIPPVCEPLAQDVQVNNVAECPACPCEVDETAELQPSVAALFQKAAGICEDGKDLAVLNLGLGGGTLHSHLRHRCPATTRVRSVEIDPRIAAAASRYFGVPLEPGASEIVVGDAASVVAALASGLRSGPSSDKPEQGEGHKHPIGVADEGGDGAAASPVDEPSTLGESGWDIIAVDCFIGGGRTPEACRSKAFIQNLKAILKPNGVILHHLWHESPQHPTVASEFSSAVEFYKSTFGNDHVSVEPVYRPQANLMVDDIVVVRV